MKRGEPHLGKWGTTGPTTARILQDGVAELGAAPRHDDGARGGRWPRCRAAAALGEAGAAEGSAGWARHGGGPAVAA